jgi:anti-sigma factor RsiW
MTTKRVHYTLNQFNELVDGRLAADEAQLMRHHIALCNECHAAFASLARIDTSLRNLPLERTSHDFTRLLMESALAAPKAPAMFRLLEKLSYVFGLLIVLGIMIASFVVTGVFDTTQVDQTRSVATGIANNVGEGLASSINRFTGLLVQYLPFAFGKGSMSIAFFAVLIVAMLAGVDRVVGRRVLKNE